MQARGGGRATQPIRFTSWAAGTSLGTQHYGLILARGRPSSTGALAHRRTASELWSSTTPALAYDTCTGVRPETDTQVFCSPNREAPAFFSHAGGYYLWASGTLGWSPVQGYLYRGPTPLGPFNSTLGHGWHAFVKGADFNSTGAWHIRDGYLPSGHDWVPQRQTDLCAQASMSAQGPSATLCLCYR